jgi:DNA-binding transcriptional MerR regulator
MNMKKHTIRPVCDLTGFSPSTLRRYEAEFGYIFMPQRIKVGKKDYRIYTWREIEMLLYVKQKVKEGYTVKQAWDSFYDFDFDRLGAASAMDEEVYYFKPELEYWVSDEEISQEPLN